MGLVVKHNFIAALSRISALLQGRKIFLRKTTLFFVRKAVNRHHLLSLHLALIFKFCNDNGADKHKCVDHKQRMSGSTTTQKKRTFWLAPKCSVS